MITLRPYQKDAAENIERILRTHRMAYLAGEVRCGKTFTALEVVRSIGYASALVVTKKKAIKSIENDRDAIGLTDIVTVINFEQAHKHHGKSYGLLIVDEAHGVGSYPKPSKRYKDLQGIHRSAVLLMSGTPSPESYSQLFHQFALGGASGPWAGHRTFYAWANAGYVNVKQKYVGTGQKVNDYSEANKARIFPDIRHLVVKMTQEQAGFETQITETVHRVQMLPRTYRMARRIMKDGVIGLFRADGKAGRSILADTGAAQMSKLRQMYSGTVITEDHGAVVFDRSKVEYIQRTFTAKHAILYTFNAEGEMLKEAYAGRWTDDPERFNTDPALTFIGQVRASREGVNLSTADDLIFFGIDYAALSFIQGRDRASYLGRTRENRVHWILADGGIETKVWEAVQGKNDYTLAHYRADKHQLQNADHELYFY